MLSGGLLKDTHYDNYNEKSKKKTGKFHYPIWNRIGIPEKQRKNKFFDK